MDFSRLILLLLGLYVAYNGITLFRNYLKARRMGLPIVIVPICSMNILWQIFSRPVYYFCRRTLPEWISARILLAVYGYPYDSKWDDARRWGKLHVSVFCDQIRLCVNDPDVAMDVCKRTDEFGQSDFGASLVNAFGPNVDGTNGPTWARHRRLIAPGINEKVAAIAFEETQRQAHRLVEHIRKEKNGQTNQIVDFTKTIAINVLGQSAYGERLGWELSTTENTVKAKTGSHMSFMESLVMIVENFATAAFISPKILTLPCFPPSVRNIGYAQQQFPLRAREIEDKERERLAEGKERHTILTTIVQATDRTTSLMTMTDEEKIMKRSKSELGFLTPEEALGNLFILCLAGFDTAALTQASGLVYLATYPKWQGWLREEIDSVLQDSTDQLLDYHEYFPKLVRCLAFMFETLRLRPPAVNIGRDALGYNSVLTVKHEQGADTHHVIPHNTMIDVNMTALHRDPETWGPDVEEFRASRWIRRTDGSTTDDASASHRRTRSAAASGEELIVPRRGIFMPWITGPRTCPGQKMSQVEFVATLATVLRGHRIEAVRLKGGKETDDELRRRLEGEIDDSCANHLLSFNHPERIWLRFIPRSS